MVQRISISLAEKLKRPAQYDLLYREWSGYSHGTESLEGTVDFKKGEIGFHQLRNPNNAEFMVFVAITFALDHISDNAT